MDTLDNNLIKKGFEKKYYDITNHKNNDDDINYYNVDKIHNNLDNKSKNKIYKCFDMNNLVVRTNNKKDCEKEVYWNGKTKNLGVWDTPCKNDDECLYYKTNKNYKNSYGKCMKSGYCQMPLNVENIGYHFKKKHIKPKCYNCDNKEWKPFTKIDTCCEEQDKNSNKYDSKYDFLKSPDYAYKNDLNLRINNYSKNNSYIKYNNLFNNDYDYYMF